MADFVAVIRRAVDGLATNTPETRAKVYEKARGAVQRQLENMKPRPPEEMLLRQLDKLDAAIQEVESEHREAADEVSAAAPVDEAPAYQPVAEEAPVHEEPVAEAPAHHEPEPVAHSELEPVAEPVHADEPSHDVSDDHHAEPAEAESVEASEPHAAPPAWDEVAAPHQHEEVRAEAEEERPAVPSFFDQVPDRDEPVQHETVSHPAHDEDLPYRQAESHAEEIEQPVALDHGWPPQTQPAEQDRSFEGAGWQDQHHPLSHEEPAVAAPADRDPFADDDHHGAAAAWNDVPELTVAGPVEPVHQPSSGHVDAHFDHETHVAANAVRMPTAADFSDMPVVQDERTPVPADPFAEYLGAEAKAAPAAAKSDDRDPWSDLEDLIGYTKDQPQQTAAESRAATAAREEDELADLMARPAKPYRVAPARKRNYAGLVLGLVGLLVVAGGAYAVWLNRASLDDMIGGLMSSGSSSTQQASQTAPAQTAPAGGGSAPAATTPAPQTSAAQNAPADTKPAATPTADGSTNGPKFTQQLMPDGSEVDRGPGAAGSLAQSAEGQSVAQLNAPPTTPAANPSAPAAPATPAPGNAAPAPAGTPTPSATPAEVPAASGEKMFLYEERIGQTAPTAVDGTVSWSLKREPGANGGPPEAEVQGRISVPGRGLTALVTLKRNSDPSLPASHLIEIVFAVPPDFEGGAIDSVQRIAMKQTEQDRGNALIAVPAKITDDFHMIALNDFPDARKTNLDLLKSRNWIDIPVAYRNGRRALLTLQKGPAGEKAFNDAINEWASLPASPGAQ